MKSKDFDNKTSLLQCLISLMPKNDVDVLRLFKDFGPVKAAERVAVEILSQQLNELSNGVNLVKKMTKKYSPIQGLTGEETNDPTPGEKISQQCLWVNSLAVQNLLLCHSTMSSTLQRTVLWIF